MSEQIHDLAAAFVLGALDPDDQVAFEAHLETCEQCRRDVEGFAQVTTELAWEHAESPPGSLRESVLAAVARTTVGSNAAVIPLRNRPRWIPIGVAAVLVAVAVAGWSAFGAGRLMTAILADPGAVSIAAEATDAGTGHFSEAHIVYSPDRSSGVLIVSGLRSLADDRVYEIWIVGESGPAAAGTFNPDVEGDATVLVDGEISPGLVVAVTEEPLGGVAAPTGEVLLTAAVDI
jgi:anti-sigma-K factor RskA